MELITKELFNVGHPLTDKIQVTIILPSFWDHIVSSLTHSGKEIIMTSLPVLLALEEGRVKRRNIENGSSKRMMSQDTFFTEQDETKTAQEKKMVEKWAKKTIQ